LRRGGGPQRFAAKLHRPSSRVLRHTNARGSVQASMTPSMTWLARSVVLIALGAAACGGKEATSKCRHDPQPSCAPDPVATAGAGGAAAATSTVTGASGGGGAAGTSGATGGMGTGGSAPSDFGDPCSINSDCSAPLTCAFKRCHSPCETTRDCPAGTRCVHSIDVDTGTFLFNICRLPDEAHACIKNSDCIGLEICGVDGRCRDQCETSADCVRAQVCVTKTCADPDEVPALDGGVVNPVDASR
jgi:hypothetical protein